MEALVRIEELHTRVLSGSKNFTARMEAQLAPPVSHETVVRWGGRVLVLQRADNETGFLNVNKQKDRNRKKPYYAKYTSHTARRPSAH